MGMALAAWLVITALIGSELRQVFQPLGMGFSAMIFFGAFTGIGIALIIMVLSPRRHCSECGGKLPRFRKPVSLNQALWGGWECPHCHADLSPDGKRARTMAHKAKS